MLTQIRSENGCHYTTRAKYIRDIDGNLRLVCVQQFNVPKFKPDGWELSEKSDSSLSHDKVADEVANDYTAANIQRASRRAKINAFDVILCNPCLDTFATFTYRPENEFDKSSYEDCYKVLSVWLSNRVQRRDLKYVIVPEYHKSGDIHFHGILNSSALKLERAVSPRTGRALTRNGLPIYNMTDWKSGFSTAQIIGSDEVDRDKVAKYIFKYMGKQVGQKIGGRYALIGGNVEHPTYRYVNEQCEWFFADRVPKYEKNVELEGGLTYREVTFI